MDKKNTTKTNTSPTQHTKIKTRSKTAAALLGTLGIILIIVGGLTIILTLGGLLFALLGITDVDLAEIGGSSADPISTWGAFLLGAIIGFVILMAGLGTFIQRKNKSAKSKLPPLPY